MINIIYNGDDKEAKQKVFKNYPIMQCILVFVCFFFQVDEIQSQRQKIASASAALKNDI